MNKDQIKAAIFQQRLLPLYYHPNADVSLDVAIALYDAGIRVMEYTNRGAQALANFTYLLQARAERMPGMVLIIGTIKNTNEAQTFMDAGADAVICPGMIPEVGHLVQSANKLWIPGCMTTTEIMQAEQAGARFIKLFPGNLLGPEYVKAIQPLFPEMAFMPTGGVEMDQENITAWFASGVKAVGMGSKLIGKELLDHKDYAAIESRTKEALQLIQNISA